MVQRKRSARVARSIVVALTVVCGALVGVASPAAAAPANDLFVNAITLPVPASVTGDTTGATGEVDGDPCSQGAGDQTPSVWYRFTAPADGSMALELASVADLGVSVFSGTASSDLTLESCVDNHWGGDDEVLVVSVTAGESYSVSIAGYTADDFGPFRLDLSHAPYTTSAPTNDLPSAPAALTAPALTSGDLTHATVGLEPAAASCVAGDADMKSVFYEYRATTDGVLDIRVAGESDFVLAAWELRKTGPVERGCADIGWDFDRETLPLRVRRGATYRVFIGMYTEYSYTSGAFVLRTLREPGPANDLPANATSLTPSSVATGTTRGATLDETEPAIPCGWALGAVWYRFSAPGDGAVELRLDGYGYPVIAVYSASRRGELADQGCGSDSMHLPVSASTTYYVAIAYERATGIADFDLSLEFFPAPLNDSFSSPTPLALPASIPGDTRGATVEPDERDCFTTTGGGSLWYSVVPASDGRLSAYAGDFDVSVHKGESLDGLDTISCGGWDVDVTAGERYYLRVVPRYENGPFTLDVRLEPAPANDDFADARPVTELGTTASFSGTTLGSTKEAGEVPSACGATVFSGGVWYRYDPPADGSIALTAAPGSTSYVGLSVYSGSELASLTEVACGIVGGATSTPLVAPVVGGESYWINAWRSASLDVTFSAQLAFAPADPFVSVSVSDAGTLIEDNGTDYYSSRARFIISLSEPSNVPVSVRSSARGVTASADDFYDGYGGTRVLSFAPGETSKLVEILIRGDAVDEPNETFEVVLADAENASISDARGTATIEDNDEPPPVDEPGKGGRK